MSEVYLKNYWLLNLEYIKVFSELVHHKISLPLLSNFYQYLEEDVKSKMKSKDFYKYLSVAPIEEKQLQSEFEKWLPLLEQTTKKRGPDGVVLLNTDYLRFSAGNFSHFNPKYTKILTRAKKASFMVSLRFAHWIIQIKFLIVLIFSLKKLKKFFQHVKNIRYFLINFSNKTTQ